MKRNGLVVSVTLGLCLILLSGPRSAKATILVFETEKDVGFEYNTPIDQDYGDNVASSLQAGYYYGEEGEGFTPNVVVEYSVLDPGGDDQNVNSEFEVLDGFGDLGAALGDFQAFDMRGELILTPDPDYLVHLQSFDVATWNAGDSGTMQVTGDSENTQTVTVSGLGENDHMTVSFTSMRGTSDTPIRIWSGDFGTLGIDNVRFSQSVVPEPSMIALWSILGGGCGWLVWRRRRA